MKKTKLKIENFLANKLANQIIIIGGGERTALEAPLEGGSGGSTVSTGNGGGGTNDLGDVVLPPIPELLETP